MTFTVTLKVEALDRGTVAAQVVEPNVEHRPIRQNHLLDGYSLVKVFGLSISTSKKHKTYLTAVTQLDLRQRTDNTYRPF